MKLSLITTFIAFVIIFLLGFWLGGKYQTSGGGGINILPIGCTYNGIAYKHGDGFKSSDGCNSCSCQSGQIACTEMACLPD